MNGIQLGLFTLVGMAIGLGGSSPVQAQIYGGIGYGHHHHHAHHHLPGYYGPGYGVGAYPFNAWYVSPYRAISPGYVGTYGQGFGYTATYGVGQLGYGPGYGLVGPVVVPPVYGTTTTIIRGGPTGGVVQYSNNGNGYTYVPDSTYPTVIQQYPTLGLSRTYIPPSPPPVVRELPPRGSPDRVGSSTSSVQQYSTAATTTGSGGMIKLICPKTAGGPLSYSLNGHVYTIQPGYSQSFREDRAWTLEFKRGGDDSEVARYSLKAGTYTFAVGAGGWELQQPGDAPASDLPPAPLPDLSTEPTPSVPNSPLPPP